MRAGSGLENLSAGTKNKTTKFSFVDEGVEFRSWTLALFFLLFLRQWPETLGTRGAVCIVEWPSCPWRVYIYVYLY